MELRNISTFLTAAELLSFAKTADMLGYAQSTVTMQIKQLEEELGQLLFERSNRTVSLTSFGEAYLPLARRMMNTAQEMQNLNTDPAQLSGTLHIGVIESLFFTDFLGLIPRYQEKFPNVILDFYTASSAEIADSLQKSKLDIGCCLAKADLPDGLTQVFSRDADMVFVANANHPLAGGKQVALATVAKESFVLTEAISVYHQALLSLFRQNGLAIKANILLKSTRGIVELLKYSGGLSFLPHYAVCREIEQGILAVIPTTCPTLTVTVTVATHKDKWISPQMQGFLDLLREEVWI